MPIGVQGDAGGRILTDRLDLRPVAVEDADELATIGMLQAIFTDGGQAAEIAWVVGVPWQGQGLATEATRAVVAWLDTQGVRTITAWIRPDHQASASVARRAGLMPTEEYRDTELDREQRWRRRM